MSVDLNVYLRRSSMPAPAAWQDAIRAAGFAVEIDTNFDVESLAGFLPCKLNGQLSGFEYFASHLDELEAADEGAPPGSDFSVMLSTHASDLRELAVSLAAASVLCQISGGLLVDPQSGESYAGAAAVEWAKQELAELRRHLK